MNINDLPIGSYKVGTPTATAPNPTTPPLNVNQLTPGSFKVSPPPDPYAQIKAQQPQQSGHFGSGPVGGFFKSLVTGITNPLITSVARPVQAAVSAYQYSKNPLAPSKTSFNLPFFGNISGLENQTLTGKNVEKVTGEAAQTAALGLGPVEGGALYGAGQAASQGGGVGQVATGAVVGGVLGKGLEVGAGLLGKGLQATGGFVKEAGLGSEALQASAAKDYAKVLNPTTKINKAITAKIAPEMADRGIIALTRNQLLSKAEQQVEKVGGQLEDAWNALPDNHKTAIKPILQNITKAQDELTIVNPKGKAIIPEGNTAQFQKLGDLKKELVSISGSPNMPTRLMNEYRQTLDAMTKKAGKGFGLGLNDSATVTARKQVANAIRGELAKSTPNIAKINNEFTFWKRIQDVLGATIERKQGQATPLGQKIARGAGAAAGLATHGITGGLEGGLIMQGVEKVLTSSAWDTVSGALKSKLADALALGENTTISKALGEIVHTTGAGLETAGKIIGGVPKALKDLPREQIPGTPTMGEVGKGILDKAKNANIGLSIEDVSGKEKTPSGASYAPKELRALRPTSEKSTTPSSVSEPSVAQTSESVKPTFKGFKDLSTKILEKLKGRSEVSKQFISDLTNSGDVKQSERDLIRQTLNDFPDKVPVKEFANAVKTELLPLERSKPTDRVGRYENITLPEELRGNVADYKENIYKSPIKTSAGDVHFSHFDDNGNYFAHTRVEDMANSFVDKSTRLGEPVTKEQLTASGGTTRRVIELQSDLFQKGRLEGEGAQAREILGSGDELQKLKDEKLNMDLEAYGKDGEGMSEMADPEGFNQRYAEVSSRINQLEEGGSSVSSETNKFIHQQAHQRADELAKLEPYRNTWHERIIKEEVKQAAKDGKTKLQFPTGETAMKIEGLGANSDNWLYRPNPANDNYERMVNTDALKVGREVAQPGGDSWIITDVLGDGKFKAITKQNLDIAAKDRNTTIENLFKKPDYVKLLQGSQLSESFDISGKVDTNNPIYKFYEKTVGKYLINNLGATRITDPQGVQWYQVPIKKSQAKAPIIAKKDTKSDLA